MSRRDRRIVLTAIVILVVVFGGIGTWAALRPGRYDQSRDGCITVNLPSSMGGSLFHQCAGQARTTCHDAFAQQGAAARLIRPQCRLAGLAPAAAGASAAAGS
ncbi:MAG: hypothetical protein ACLQDY_12155 [Streptosporangiaceae bacterium]